MISEMEHQVFGLQPMRKLHVAQQMLFGSLPHHGFEFGRIDKRGGVNAVTHRIFVPEFLQGAEFLPA